MRLRNIGIAACGVAFSLGLGTMVAAQQKWGDLEGTFKIDGQVPAPAPVVVNVDKAFCGPFNLVDESLVVGRRDGIANILVMLEPRQGAPAPAIHPDVAKAATKEVVFNNAQCEFEPRIGVVSPNQPLKIGNVDQIGHNVNAGFIDNPQFNVLIPANASILRKLPKVERPRTVTCNIHPWMKGWLTVTPTPYAAVTDDRGQFEIEKLPVGTWQFYVWHERSGHIEKGKKDGKEFSWAKGIVEVEIKEGKNDLGEVLIPAAEF